MAWTTDDLLTSVRRTGYLPDAMDLTSADLLAFGDEELATTFADIMKTSREEYRVTYADIPIVAGTSRYRMPRRALAGTVRGISYVDSSGDESPAQEIPALEAWRYQASCYSNAQAFYVFEGDEIVLPIVPTSSGAYFRVRYVRRFSRMVLVSACSTARSTGSVTVALEIDENAPAAISTAGAYIDVVLGDSPFSTIFDDRVVSSYSGTTLILEASTPIIASEINQSTATGARSDYVCPRDTTCYPPIPQELHGVLASAIVRRALEALGDPRVGVAEATLNRRLDRAVNVLEPRNQDRKPRIVDPGGRLRGARRGRR